MNAKNVSVQTGMGWIGWFFILFWNFGDNKMDLYDAIFKFLTSGVH
jgi:hypothetical protein